MADGILGDTWTYDYESNRWENMEPADTPSPRDHNVLVYSHEAGGVILVGNESGSTDCCWHYRAHENRWINISPATEAPDGRDHMQGASTPDGIFFFGGFSGGPAGARGDFWVLESMDSGS